MQADAPSPLLWRKTYISTSRCSDGPADLTAILDSSRRRNAGANVTGLLLFSGHSFYQTLEGAQDQVADTFARIICDHRHEGVIVLQDEACSDRAFAGWSMAHRDLPSNHEIAGKIDSITKGDTPAHRTNAVAAELDILITSFLTI